jgi:dipeptidase E
MKLLLTSLGISNQSIADGLIELIGKKPSETKVGFIPTAANADPGNKDWFVQQLTDLQKFGYTWIDLVDPAAVDIDYQERLKDVNIIYISGGNTFYLLDQVRKTGLDSWLDKNKDNKVYVGSSAGSILATPTIKAAGVADQNTPGLTDLQGLGWVDFELLPHVPGSIGMKKAEAYAKTTKNKFYALDDNSALKVVDGKVEVISEGEWILLNDPADNS